MYIKRIKLLLIVAAGSFCLSTFLFWMFERTFNEHIQYFSDVIWWWIVTSSTVGYGDVVPVTSEGRVITGFTILSGVYLYVNFVTLITDSVHDFLERRELGRATIKAKDHIVICEYTAIADELIQSLPESKTLSSHDVVIVSNLVPRNPYPQHDFVYGVPINPDSLRQASTGEASHVFIFANIRFADPDVKTLHIASRVISLNPNAKIFVEMIDPNSYLLQYLPDSLIVMPSRKLTEHVLQDLHLDPLEWAEQCA